MIRRPPRSTLFPTRRSSDLTLAIAVEIAEQRLDRSVAGLGLGAKLGQAQSLGLCEASEGAKGNQTDRKSTRLNSSHSQISYAVFCLKKKKKNETNTVRMTEQ